MTSNKAEPQSAPAGRFAYEALDRVFHEKARLGILTALLAHPGGRLFNDLKEVCALTDGNLNRHLAVLQEAELIEIKKTDQAKRPQSVILMTNSGRKRFQEYIAALEQVIADALESQKQAAASAKNTKLNRGWSTA